MTKEVPTQGNHVPMRKIIELAIFTDEEKRFLFENFLCNPEEVDAASISVALVKVF